MEEGALEEDDALDPTVLAKRRLTFASFSDGTTGYEEDIFDVRAPPRGAARKPFKQSWVGQTWFYREGSAPAAGEVRRRVPDKRPPAGARLPVGDGPLGETRFRWQFQSTR